MNGLSSIDAMQRKHARQERDAFRGRLGAGRYGAAVRDLAGVIRMAFEAGITGSMFGLEGPLRADLRADLCRQGWRWGDADRMAREMLDDAFRAVRANRPGWEEGQPEWTIHAGTMIGRTQCAHCHKPLPDGRPKFCSNRCKTAYHMRITRLKEATEDMALDMAIRLT